jgi:hypothetical protein
MTEYWWYNLELALANLAELLRMTDSLKPQSLFIRASLVTELQI